MNDTNSIISQFNLSLFCPQKHPMSNPEKKLSLFPKYQNSITLFSSIYHFFSTKTSHVESRKKKRPTMSCLKEVTSSVPREFTGGEFMVMTPTPGGWFSGDFHGNIMGFFQDFMGMSWGFIVISWEFHADEWEYIGYWMRP